MDKRALICEDDPAIRSLVKTVISRLGFHVDVAPDGEAGIAKMKEDCHELVVLDLMMPGVDGYGVIEWLKNTRPTTIARVIVMTAASEALRKDFPEPICTLLPKPFDIEALTSAVRDCAAECGG
ncbi:MAG TPA: response regulator [Thermoanaerobaculia bacterium]